MRLYKCLVGYKVTKSFPLAHRCIYVIQHGHCKILEALTDADFISLASSIYVAQTSSYRFSASDS